MSSDPGYSLITDGDELADGCGECPGVGQVLGDDHAARVIFDGLEAADEEFAPPVAPALSLAA